MTYFRKTLVLPHGERQVLICHTDDLPPVYPNLYFAGVFNQAFQTKRRRADSIVNLLNLTQKSGIDLFERFKSGEGLLYSEMESLGYHLHLSKKSSPETLKYVGQKTYEERCRDTLKFLKYLMRKFGDTRRDKKSYVDRVTSNLNDLSEVLSSNRSRDFKSLREGLSHTERKLILSLTNPSCPTNPFQLRVRERNSLIIQLLLQTGIRIGELLALRCDCCVSELDIEYGMQYFLRVDENLFLDEDPRSIPPEAKTQTRMIPISEGLATLVDHYIKNGRLYRGRESKKAPAFLFLNSNKKPQPLSYSSVISMLGRLESLGNGKRKVFDSIFPHRLRYTFFEDITRVLNKDPDTEDYKKIMRYVGGWSSISEQHRLYAMKQIRFSAHLSLQKLHEEYIT
jgi:integrase